MTRAISCEDNSTLSRELRALETTTTGQFDRGAALRRVLRIFWGEAEPPLRRRIVGTVALLALTALLNALVPLLFARAVDALAPAAAAAGRTRGPRTGLCGGAVAGQGAQRAALGALRADRAAHPPSAGTPCARASARPVLGLPSGPPHRPDQPRARPGPQRCARTAVRRRVPDPAAAGRGAVRGGDHAGPARPASSPPS